MDSASEETFQARRTAMVQKQIVKRGITDKRVLQAMKHIPRHSFVPDHLQKYAYDDQPLSIGNQQTISQPYIVALMTEALALKTKDRVLEIGTGSGYQAAILAELVAQVYTIEIVEDLARQAVRRFSELGIFNIECKIGDGYHGWPEKAPFDAIILTAAPPSIPDPLIRQLAPGGRVIAPVGRFSQDLILVIHQQGNMVQRRLIPVRFVPMTGTAQE